MESIFFEHLVHAIENESDYDRNLIRHILTGFGTKNRCNRFDIGNTIEATMCKLLSKVGGNVVHLPHEKGVDIKFTHGDEDIFISVKYSKVGDIKLMNSNNRTTLDNTSTFHPMLLLTPDYVYFMTMPSLLKQLTLTEDVFRSTYLKCTGDGLIMKRSLITQLNRTSYAMKHPFDINCNDDICQHRHCSELFYTAVKDEFDASLRVSTVDQVRHHTKKIRDTLDELEKLVPGFIRASH